MGKKTRAQLSAGKNLLVAGSEALAAQLAYSVDGFGRAIGTGRTKLYAEIAAGRLRARKLGRKTIITTEDGHDYLASLPVVEVR